MKKPTLTRKWPHRTGADPVLIQLTPKQIKTLTALIKKTDRASVIAAAKQINIPLPGDDPHGDAAFAELIEESRNGFTEKHDTENGALNAALILYHEWETGSKDEPPQKALERLKQRYYRGVPLLLHFKQTAKNFRGT